MIKKKNKYLLSIYAEGFATTQNFCFAKSLFSTKILALHCVINTCQFQIQISCVQSIGKYQGRNDFSSNCKSSERFRENDA